MCSDIRRHGWKSDDPQHLVLPVMRRGELYRVRKPGADPRKHRVFVVVSRQTLIDAKFSTVICAPVFSDGLGLESQVSIGIAEGLKHESAVFCDNLISIAKSELTAYVGLLSPGKLVQLDQALRVALDVR